ncbi:MAG: TorD/DmsD family molecular chaperone [Nitrososphaeria archaeon]
MSGLTEALSRAAIYGMFSNLFYRPERGMENTIQAFLSIAGQERGEPLDMPADTDRLEIEYNRLFVGPGHVPCPPYESVYRKDRPLMERGLVMGPSTIDVQKRYGEAGLQKSKDFKDLPDHIAVELEFMRYLCAKEADEGPGKWRTMQVEFLNHHVKPWYLEFAECVKKHTTGFYAVLADELAKFLKEEIEDICEGR